MRRVVVDMQNALFADAIATALRDFDSDFEVFPSESPDKTTYMCADTEANVLIMEVTAYTPRKIEERMKIRDKVKSHCPDCKIVLVVDENTDKKLADKVRRAKKDGLIDNFLYGSVSATYLSAVVDTL
ncbi:MAG: 50S ribosomal protein L36 [Eubacterium sp.]